MSRKTLHQDERFHLVEGDDHVLGAFIQLFDKEMETETPEGEGLVLDWSKMFGYERNYTGVQGINALDICIKYIEEQTELPMGKE
jgi:hypothetical protein